MSDGDVNVVHIPRMRRAQPRIPIATDNLKLTNIQATSIFRLCCDSRTSILMRLRKVISDGGIIVGAGAGIGLSAKSVEQGGSDLIIIYNSGRFRMAGRGSLAGLMPYSDANAVVVDMVYCQTHSCPGWCVRD